MNTQNTVEQLKVLKLTGMAKRYEAALALPVHELQDVHALIAMIIQAEVEYRDHARTQKYLKASKLRYHALPEDILCNAERGITREQILRLSDGMFIEKGENVLITGATGCGKTWLACALGNAACRQGLSVAYVRMPRLFEELRIAHGDGSFGKRLTALAKADLLILDDWGLAPLNQAERNDLLEVLDDRVGTRSTAITSQLSAEHWHAYLNDPTLADAILDRVLHAAHRLPLTGESQRNPKQAQS